MALNSFSVFPPQLPPDTEENLKITDNPTVIAAYLPRGTRVAIFRDRIRTCLVILGVSYGET
jgi:hypothetical protein